MVGRKGLFLPARPKPLCLHKQACYSNLKPSTYLATRRTRRRLPLCESLQGVPSASILGIGSMQTGRQATHCYPNPGWAPTAHSDGAKSAPEKACGCGGSGWGAHRIAITDVLAKHSGHGSAPQSQLSQCLPGEAWLAAPLPLNPPPQVLGEKAADSSRLPPSLRLSVNKRKQGRMTPASGIPSNPLKPSFFGTGYAGVGQCVTGVCVSHGIPIYLPCHPYGRESWEGVCMPA